MKNFRVANIKKLKSCWIFINLENYNCYTNAPSNLEMFTFDLVH